MLLQPKFNQMTQNDPKWPKMTQNDPKWPKMTQNGPKWPKMTQNDPKWPKMTQNGPKWPKMTQNGPKWPKMAQNDPKWHCSPRSWNLTCSKTEVNLSSAWVTRLECPKGVKDEVKQARRAKRVAEGHQLEIGAQRAPRFLVLYILFPIFMGLGNVATKVLFCGNYCRAFTMSMFPFCANTLLSVELSLDQYLCVWATLPSTELLFRWTRKAWSWPVPL